MPFFSFKYQLLSETGLLYGWISDLNLHGSSRPVKPEVCSNGDRTWHFGFQKLLFLYEHRQKKDTEKWKKIERKFKFGFFLKELEEKKMWEKFCAEAWTIPQNEETFEQFFRGLAKILKQL